MNTKTRMKKMVMEDKIEDELGFILWNAIREVSYAAKKCDDDSPLRERLENVLNELYDIDWAYEHDNADESPTTGDCDE